jgi:hypothetical protein
MKAEEMMKEATEMAIVEMAMAAMEEMKEMAMAAMEEMKEMAMAAMEEKNDNQKMKLVTITLKKICTVNIYTYFWS